MELIPPNPPFLAAQTTQVTSSRALIIGVPLDKTETFREGTKFAPDKIRQVSDSLENYSPQLQKSLEEINLVDLGNINLEELSLVNALLEIEKVIEENAQGKLVTLLGGEHTLSLASVRGLKSHYPELAVIQIDAHLDLRESYQNKKYSHATVARRIIEVLDSPKSFIQLGIRSGDKEEFNSLKYSQHYSSQSLKIPPEVISTIKEKPIYLSIDIDVLDPSVAPGTGNPEPGGFTYLELIKALKQLRGMKVIGFDLVEVSPPHDYGNITSITAAKIVRECLLLYT